MYIILPTKRFCVVQGTLEFMNEQGTWMKRGDSCFYYKSGDVLVFYKGFRRKVREKSKEEKSPVLLLQNVNAFCMCM